MVVSRAIALTLNLTDQAVGRHIDDLSQNNFLNPWSGEEALQYVNYNLQIIKGKKFHLAIDFLEF